MTTYYTRLNRGLVELITHAIQDQPDAYGRSAVIYNIVRQCYDVVKEISEGRDQDERFSAARLSDAALAHKSNMDQPRFRS